MIENYIRTYLADVDDLAELKVTLAALDLLARKVADPPSVLESEVLAHPAVRDGISFPAITAHAALQRAVARGALLGVEVGEQWRYFANTPSSQQVVELLADAGTPAHPSPQVEALADELAHLIARLELTPLVPLGPEEREMLADWLADGYTPQEITEAVRQALLLPRPASAPPRTLHHCAEHITAQPPRAPSAFYCFKIGQAPPPPGVIAFRDLWGRLPRGREVEALRLAVGLFGERAVVEVLSRIAGALAPSEDFATVLLARLNEREEALLAIQRAPAEAERKLAQWLRAYEQTLGIPPTATIAAELSAMLQEGVSTAHWQQAFAFAARQNKRSWSYLRKLLRHPSPAIFLPEPANEAARFAFEAYRLRVNSYLDPSVAHEINAVAQHVTDIGRWQHAFDRAAAADALNWNYIRAVLTKPEEEKPHDKPTRRSRSFRRPQVTYTEDQREAARERARRIIAEHEARRK
ncbi:MAG: hypothetical protein ACK4WM_03015 [Thermoflexales bacterium]